MDARELNYFGYIVRTDGTVISKKLGRELKVDYSRAGYGSITICHNGNKKRWTVHRLIATLFIPNKENKPCVNHIDGNKRNNNVSNLEWCTYAENERHSRNHLGKKIRHSKAARNKMRIAAYRHKTYLKNFMYTTPLPAKN